MIRTPWLLAVLTLIAPGPLLADDPDELPLGDLVARYARTHGPFTADAVARRLGVGVAVARHTLQRLESQGRITSGYFLPAPSTGSGRTWAAPCRS